jgi:hypothetical protein
MSSIIYSVSLFYFYFRPFVRSSRDRCYDFVNLFAEKFSEKIGVFDSNQSQIVKKIDHNSGI